MSEWFNGGRAMTEDEVQRARDKFYNELTEVTDTEMLIRKLLVETRVIALQHRAVVAMFEEHQHETEKRLDALQGPVDRFDGLVKKGAMFAAALIALASLGASVAIFRDQVVDLAQWTVETFKGDNK